MSIEELKEAFDVARETARKDPTPENWQAAKDAWDAYDSSVARRKSCGYASRAGQRQAAERRAIYGDRRKRR